MTFSSKFFRFYSLSHVPSYIHNTYTLYIRIKIKMSDSKTIQNKNLNCFPYLFRVFRTWQHQTPVPLFPLSFVLFLFFLLALFLSYFFVDVYYELTIIYRTNTTNNRFSFIFLYISFRYRSINYLIRTHTHKKERKRIVAWILFHIPAKLSSISTNKRFLPKNFCHHFSRDAKTNVPEWKLNNKHPEKEWEVN